MTGRAFLRSKTEAEADERRGFGRGAPLERSESVVGQNIGPTGADVLPFPSRLRRAGAPTAKPRRLLPFGRISLRETALAGRCPQWGQRARYPIFALLKCGPALAPRRLTGRMAWAWLCRKVLKCERACEYTRFVCCGTWNNNAFSRFGTQTTPAFLIAL